MAGQVSILDDNFVATTAVVRYTALVQGAQDQQCANPAAAGAGSFLGIAQEDKDTGLTVNVRMLGNTYVRAKGPIPVGSALVIGDANGYVDVKANVTTPKEVIGRALTAASAAGDLILMSIEKTYLAD
jgi:hypothetical protein